MKGSKFACAIMGAALVSATLLPAVSVQQALAKTVKASGGYTVVSFRASGTDTVSKFKLTEKKLIVKGTVRKGPKKLKGKSFRSGSPRMLGLENPEICRQPTTDTPARRGAGK